MLVGLYGGTFDPIHLGHTHAAVQVMTAVGLPLVHMVLAARPGHRSAPAASVDHRWQMLQLACAADDRLIADDRELRREGPSYTVDTLQAFRSETDAIPCWIVGQDSFATLPSWHRWSELLEFCNVLVVDRPGDVRHEPDEVQQLCARRQVEQLAVHQVGQICRLPLRMETISATEVRCRLRRGRSVAHLLAHPVSTYIKEHKLYATSEKTI